MAKNSYINPGCIKCGSFDCKGIKIICKTCGLKLCSNECKIVENEVCHQVAKGLSEVWCKTKTKPRKGISKFTYDRIWVENSKCTAGGYYAPPGGFKNTS